MENDYHEFNVYDDQLKAQWAMRRQEKAEAERKAAERREWKLFGLLVFVLMILGWWINR